MDEAGEGRKRGRVGGLVYVIGGFLLICAIPMLLAAAYRANREREMNSHWFDATATVRRCWLDTYHPFARDGGGTVFSLRCRLAYPFGTEQREYELHTTSDRSQKARAAIESWVAGHRPGSTLRVRVSPAHADDVAVVSALPVHQFNSVQEALAMAVFFGAAGALLTAVGRRLGRLGR